MVPGRHMSTLIGWGSIQNGQLGAGAKEERFGLISVLRPFNTF